MTPMRLSHTWSQRLYVGIFFVSITYLVLFLLGQFSTVTIPPSFQVGIIVALGALLSATASTIGFFFVKKLPSFLAPYAPFIVLGLTTALLVQQTGGATSPFLVLWVLFTFFAGLFGPYGWLPVLVLIGSYLAGSYLGGQFTVSTIILIAISGLIPLIAGVIIWRETPNSEDASQKNVKKLANQLSEVATKSEIVINAIGDGVIAVDGKGIIQLINPAAQQILGWGKQDALMLNYKSILKLSDETNKELSADEDPVQQVLNNNQQTRGSKLTAVTQSGKKIAISVVVSPIGHPGSGAIAVFRDVTNERAEEREQAEFISTASHEMRTPVASIEGYLGLALNPNTATIDAKARDFIVKAQEAAQHLGRLFQDLLDVSKSEDGRMGNNPKPVDLVAYTQTITEGLAQKASAKGLELIFKPTQANGTQRKIMPVYYVNQDNDHIREILDNLIENAIKYTPKGSVTVDISGAEDKVVVSIQDTGLGIPPEDIAHLFQKFYRIDNVDRQEIGGTGLGLYLARRLAEAMQGRLWVESTFGKGSTFFFELPRIDSQEAMQLSQQATATATPATAPAAPAPFTPETQPATSIPVTIVETSPAPAPAPAPTPAFTPTPAPAPVPTPTPTSQPAPSNTTYTEIPVAPATPTPQQPAPTPTPAPAPLPAASGVRPATTVPRGESLTREQIAERVRQLEILAAQQRNVPNTRQ